MRPGIEPLLSLFTCVLCTDGLNAVHIDLERVVECVLVCTINVDLVGVVHGDFMNAISIASGNAVSIELLSIVDGGRVYEADIEVIGTTAIADSIGRVGLEMSVVERQLVGLITWDDVREGFGGESICCHPARVSTSDMDRLGLPGIGMSNHVVMYHREIKVIGRVFLTEFL